MAISRRSFLQGSLGAAALGLGVPKLACVSPAFAAEEKKKKPMEVLRERVFFLDGITDDRSPEIMALVAKSDDAIAATLKSQFRKPGAPSDGSFWGDKGELTLPMYSGMWYTEIHCTLGRAYIDPRSRYHSSPQLLEAVEASIRFLAPALRTDPARRNGFYFWDIYNHEQTAHTLLLWGDSLSQEGRKILTDFLNTLPGRVFKVSREKGIIKPLESGSNTLDVLYGLLLRGLALRDEQWVKSAVSQLPIAFGKNPEGEGIQSDWSYHFHGHGVNLGYGQNDVTKRMQWLFLTHGTPWEIAPEVVTETLSFIREFFGLNFWKGRISPYVIDRGIATPNGVLARGMFEVFALGLLAGFPEKDRRMLADVARDCSPLETPTLYSATLQSRTAIYLAQPQSERPVLRYYPQSDYLLARQQSWFAAVRMCSLRTKAWDAQSRMNIQGASSGEFSIALMTDGKEYDNSTIATMKWNRLLGVTRCDTLEAPPMSYGQSAFVGGLSDEEELAVLGMQYLLAPPAMDTLTGNKSVFITPQALVLLGNNIRCSAEAPVATTLFHAPQEDGAVYTRNGKAIDLAKDGEWELQSGDVLLLRNVAIQILLPATLCLETREGNFAALNDPEYGEGKRDIYQKMYRRRWLYIEARHGVCPRAGQYGAVLWPGVEEGFVPPATLKIAQHESHHRLDLPSGRGAEVRFPTAWQEKGGLSYSGAEPFKWGDLALWKPATTADQYQLQMLAPRRYAAAPSSATELQLPEGFAMNHGTLMSMTGKPYPTNLLSTGADGSVKTMTVTKQP